ncbi:hypothetical protein CHH77_16760 [Shouchella clausii]|uniref:hypothetical protein n=1 Tax=Shouchella TaxID=2893057 RepID=UPI000BA58796|nr:MULTISPECIES: hypothetical protein [Shouchella]MCM3381222.1 hypothetical protein [Shouchella rhizosphaerae]PAE80397.1 hypothetical protein CHH77_16760 [Shouchella clausii]
MENLKSYNTTLFSFVILNILLVVGLDSYLALSMDKLNTETLIKFLPLPSIVLLSTIVLNGILSSNLKYKLVFMRMSNPLPASRLQETLRNDHRVSIDQVTKKFGPIPNEPKQQNMYWYQKIYKHAQNSEKVRDIHKKFLMTRDLTAMCFMILIFSILNTLILTGTWIHVFIILGEYLIIRLVAANYGKRFVATVVAESI